MLNKIKDLVGMMKMQPGGKVSYVGEDQPIYGKGGSVKGKKKKTKKKYKVGGWTHSDKK